MNYFPRKVYLGPVLDHGGQFVVKREKSIKIDKGQADLERSRSWVSKQQPLNEKFSNIYLWSGPGDAQARGVKYAGPGLKKKRGEKKSKAVAEGGKVITKDGFVAKSKRDSEIAARKAESQKLSKTVVVSKSSGSNSKSTVRPASAKKVTSDVGGAKAGWS